MQELDDLLPLLEAIISYINEGVIIGNAEGAVYYMNPSAHELLNVPANTPILKFADITAADLGMLVDRPVDAGSGSVKYYPSTGRFNKFEQRINVSGECRDLEFECCRQIGSKLLLLIVRDITQRKKLQAFLSRASGDLVTNDPKMIEVLDRVEHIAPQDAAILLQGESGTGKTHIARLIHRLSKRADGPFVEVNCAAIPETLLESELFGHVKGSFTGAVRHREGRFLSAHKGTLFLDEVGEIPLHLQAKLLRAVQELEFEPVGSDKTVKVDVRIISSSNRNLRHMVDEGTFRADLYYRLVVIPLYIPPVRERPGDIPILLKHFCYNLESRGYPSDIECSPESMRMLMNYTWPGNVRELENAVEHAIICAVDKTVRPESLPVDIRRFSVSDDRDQALQVATSQALEQVEIEKALKRAEGNKTLAAKFLGIDRTTLWRRMRRFKLQSQ